MAEYLHFTYDLEKDVYICPQGNQMTTNNTWHHHSDIRRGKPGAYRFRRFNTTACKTCTSRNLCTRTKPNGRYIDRSEYADIVEENMIRVQNNPDYYRKGQQITEHMFGTLKRQRGFTFTLMRGKDKVLGEVGLMFIGYNLSRWITPSAHKHWSRKANTCSQGVLYFWFFEGFPACFKPF